jgi:hypothetical protein
MRLQAILGHVPLPATLGGRVGRGMGKMAKTLRGRKTQAMAAAAGGG